MLMRSYFAASLWLLVGFLNLLGCSSYVRFPYPPIAETATGAVAGAGVGAAVGGSSIGAATGIGALIGGSIGAYMGSETRWLKKLLCNGVQVVQLGDFVRIIIPADQIFLATTPTFLPQSDPILQDVTDFIGHYGPVYLSVNAYTDNIATAATNLWLSKVQAKAVLAYLWAHGIPSSRLRSCGLGQQLPIAANYTPRGSAYNRRIEITFWAHYPHEETPATATHDKYGGYG